MNYFLRKYNSNNKNTKIGTPHFILSFFINKKTNINRRTRGREREKRGTQKKILYNYLFYKFYLYVYV